MSSKVVRISIVLLCLLALVIPSPAKSAAGEIPSPLITTPPAGAFVSTEANPSNLHIGETALVSVNLNSVPVEGYKSAEFTCTYNASLVEKSNIVAANLFGADAVVAIHEHQAGTFIVAIAGANSNRATTGGTAFSFSAKGLQAGQSAVQCTARVSKGDNLAIDIPSIGADLTVLGADLSPTPFVPATPGEHEHPTPVSTALESPTPLPAGSLSGQLLASKPVTVRLLDANQVEITSALANPDGIFLITPPPGDYILVATASGFLSYQGSLTITDGNETVFPTESLLAGDVDGTNVIDQFDALTIGMNYTASTPEAADLNNDGAIDFLDLELLAENYRQTGPTTGTSYSILSLLKKKGPAAPTRGPKQTVIAPMATSSPIPGSNQTVIAPTATQRTGTTGAGAPFAGAPLCPTHDPAKWHGLWDSARGCHYDHEHGQNPFTPEVANAFPGFDLLALQGGVEVGHTNPSSPIENVHQHGGKHGGMKWQVSAAAPQGCITGFEDGTVAIDAYAIQYHAFGRQDIEFEARNHSSVAMLRQCNSGNPSDKGYIFVNQLQEYGQRVMPYQGMVLPYPDNFQPQFDSPRGQYLTTECFGQSITVGGQLIACRPTFNDGSNNLSIWSSKVTGNGPRPPGSTVFTLLARWRDNYQRLDITDLQHPFTWMFVCGGVTYNPAGCRFNNSTATIHEIAGRIPASWDNLAGFDTNPTVGRITAQGFVTQFGALNLGCTAAGGSCYPIKMVNAFVGFYSSELNAAKVSNPTPFDTPERDIYFCGTAVCTETSPGAVPSGWIGAEN